MRNMILFSGSSAVGKTTVLKSLLPMIRQRGGRPAICKIDCLGTDDHRAYRAIGLPCVVGLSGDICPDHFLVSNLPELWNWTERVKCDLLFLETAGLCHPADGGRLCAGLHLQLPRSGKAGPQVDAGGLCCANEN